MIFKNLIKIILILTLCINFTNAEEDLSCWTKNWEERYNCQVKNFCEVYKVDEINHKSEDYFKEDKTWWKRLFTSAKEKYRENQNNIYKCAIIKLQKNWYKLVLKKLIEKDSWWTLKSRVNQKFNLKIQKLDQIYKQLKCLSPQNKEEWNSLQFKKNLLNESAYEYCKYNYYLNYLKNHYKNIENANKEYFWDDKKNSFKVSQVAAIQSKLQQDILDEQKHSSKVFSMAFATYIDYENNYPVHILLELLKEDFYVLRRKLHEAISPINQVVYKISNAMSIH